MERNSTLSNDLKHHSICSGRVVPMKENNSNISRLKDSWDSTSYNSNINGIDSTLGGDLLGGFSWPPRSYTCTFCKREFRSAQALGGHMNVHRRDRARLRQSPPSETHQLYPAAGNLLNLNLDPNPYPNINPNPNPNPNPNFSSSSQSQPSSPQRMFPPFTSKLPPLLSPTHSTRYSHSEIFEYGTADHSSAPTHRLCPRGLMNSAKMKSHKTLLGVDRFDGFSHEKECKILKKAEIVRLNLEIGLLGESKVDDLDLELRLGYS